MNNFWNLVAELGLPIVATIGLGAFIMIIIKYILGSVVSSITFIQNVISQLDNRVKTMNNDILKIDQEVSEQLGLLPGLLHLVSVQLYCKRNQTQIGFYFNHFDRTDRQGTYAGQRFN